MATATKFHHDPPNRDNLSGLHPVESFMWLMNRMCFMKSDKVWQGLVPGSATFMKRYNEQLKLETERDRRDGP